MWPASDAVEELEPVRASEQAGTRLHGTPWLAEPPLVAGGFELGDRWNATHRDVLVKDLLASGVDAQATVTRLDDYTDRWIQARAEVCREQADGGASTLPRLARSLRCLDRRRFAVVATLDVLSSDAAINQRQVEAVIAALPRVADCADPRFLAAEVAPPPEHLQERVQEVREAIARTAALTAASRVDDARSAAEAATAAARALDYPPLVLDAINRHTAALRMASEVEAAAELANEGYALSDLGSRHAAGINLTERSAIAVLEGAHVTARSEARRAVALFENALGPEHPSTAMSWNQLGNARRAAQDPEGAVEAYERGYEIIKDDESVDDGPRIRQMVGLGAGYGDAGRHVDALEVFGEALSIASVAKAQWGITMLQSNIGATLMSLGRYGEAEKQLEEALVHAEKLDLDHYTMRVRANLGNAHAHRGDFEGALPHHRAALAIGERLLAPGSPEQVALHRNLAVILRQTSDTPGCLRHAQEVLRLVNLDAQADPRRLASAHSAVAGCLVGADRLEEALEHARQARSYAEEFAKSRPVEAAQRRMDLTEVLEELGRFGEAEREQRVTAEVMTRELGASHPRAVSANAIHARLLFRAGRVADAQRVVERVAGNGAGNPLLVEVQQLLAASTVGADGMTPG